MSIVSSVFSPRSPLFSHARLTSFMDSIFAIGFGLGLRFVVGAVSRHDFKLTGTLVGLWEGVVTLHFVKKMPSSFDPYVAYGVRMFVDLLVTESLARMILVIIWTGLGMVLADIAPDLWMDVGLHRVWRRLRRDSYTLYNMIPKVAFFPKARTVRFSPSRETSIIDDGQFTNIDPISTVPQPSLSEAIPITQASRKRRLPGHFRTDFSETSTEVGSLLGLRPETISEFSTIPGTARYRGSIYPERSEVDETGSDVSTDLSQNDVDDENLSSSRSSTSSSDTIAQDSLLDPSLLNAPEIDVEEVITQEAAAAVAVKEPEAEVTPRQRPAYLPPTPSDSAARFDFTREQVPPTAGLEQIPDFMDDDWDHVNKAETEDKPPTPPAKDNLPASYLKRQQASAQSSANTSGLAPPAEISGIGDGWNNIWKNDVPPASTSATQPVGSIIPPTGNLIDDPPEYEDMYLDEETSKRRNDQFLQDTSRALNDTNNQWNDFVTNTNNITNTTGPTQEELAKIAQLEEQKRREEDEQRRKEEEGAARKKAEEEEALQKAEEEKKRKKEEEKEKKALEAKERKRRAEEEKQRQLEMIRKKREDEQKRVDEERKKKEAEEQEQKALAAKAAEERRRREEEERKRKEEEQRKLKEEEQRKLKEEEERKLKEEEEMKLKEEEEKLKEEERKRKEEKERKLKEEEEERKRKEDEESKLAAQVQAEAEEQTRREEEQKRREEELRLAQAQAQAEAAAEGRKREEEEERQREVADLKRKEAEEEAERQILENAEKERQAAARVEREEQDRVAEEERLKEGQIALGNSATIAEPDATSTADGPKAAVTEPDTEPQIALGNSATIAEPDATSTADGPKAAVTEPDTEPQIDVEQSRSADSAHEPAQGPQDDADADDDVAESIFTASEAAHNVETHLHKSLLLRAQAVELETRIQHMRKQAVSDPDNLTLQEGIQHAEKTLRKYAKKSQHKYEQVPAMSSYYNEPPSEIPLLKMTNWEAEERLRESLLWHIKPGKKSFEFGVVLPSGNNAPAKKMKQAVTTLLSETYIIDPSFNPHNGKLFTADIPESDFNDWVLEYRSQNTRSDDDD